MAELDAILGNDEGGMDMGMGDTNQGARGGTRPTSNSDGLAVGAGLPGSAPWRGDLVDALLDAAEQQEAMVKATVEQGGDVDECLFSAPLYESELARCRFVVGSYVRCRLRKLERQCGYIIADDDAYGRLSDAEKTHAVKYLDLIEKHHRASLLEDLPEPFRDERKDGDEACPEVLAKAISKAPALDRFVFIKANKDGRRADLEWRDGVHLEGDARARYGPCGISVDAVEAGASPYLPTFGCPRAGRRRAPLSPRREVAIATLTLGAISTSARNTTASSFTSKARPASGRRG